METTADKLFRETEDRLILLEKKAETLEQQVVPPWTGILLVTANVFMGSALVLVILQTTL